MGEMDANPHENSKYRLTIILGRSPACVLKKFVLNKYILSILILNWTNEGSLAAKRKVCGMNHGRKSWCEVDGSVFACQWFVKQIAHVSYFVCGVSHGNVKIQHV